MIELTGTALELAQLLAEDEGGSIQFLGLLLFFSGPVFYVLVYMRYRNWDKRHKHEEETEASIHDLIAEDTLVEHRTGLRNARMLGSNHREVRGVIR